MILGVVGAGWVGDIQGHVFADEGCPVIFCDNNKERVRQINAGECPFHEKGLPELSKEMHRLKRVNATMDLVELVRKTTAAFVCVPTPPLPEGGTDLSIARNVVSRIIEINGRSREYVIVIKSTINADVFSEIEALADGTFVEIAINPEFLAEGTAIADCKLPSRIVVGVRNRKGAAFDLFYRLYGDHAEGGRPYFVLTPEEAILVKQVSNLLLPLKISVANEVALICELIGKGCNARRILQAVGADPRIGPKFLHPGPGFGGDCFYKDVYGYAAMAKRQGIESFLAEAVLKTNFRQLHHLSALVDNHFQAVGLGGVSGKRIAVLGAAFKGGTSDIRNSPAVEFICQIMERGASVRLYDPAVDVTHVRQQVNILPSYAGTLVSLDSSYLAASSADAVAILTDWSEFRQIDWSEMRKGMKMPLVFDGRAFFDPVRMAEAGLVYYSIGRTHPAIG